MEEDPRVQAESASLLVLTNDQDADAPEADIVANAQRLNGSGTGLQVAFNNGPEIFYGGPLPEPLPENATTKPPESTDHHFAKILGLQKKLFITSTVVTLVILMAIGLAVGIKFGVINKSHTPTPLPTPVSPVVSVSASPVLLNNTPIASCILSTGDRHLFFQDYNNTIRHIIRLASTNQWITELPRPLVDAEADEAKSHTPLTVHSDPADIIRMFYVDRNNTLSSVNFYRKWNNEKVKPLTGVHQDSRQLSAINEWNDMSGNFPNNVSGPSKNALFNSQSANYYHHIPQFCRTEPSLTVNEVRYSVCFAISCTDAVPGIRPSNCTWVSSKFQEISNCKACLGEDSDIVFVDYGQTTFIARLGWVDNGKLVMTSLEPSPKPNLRKRDIPVPVTTFPFSRLATSPFFGFTYLYHQFDNFTITEHEFNANISAWTSSSNITVFA